MKLFASVAFTLLAVYAVCTYGYNQTWGTVSYNDRLLAINKVSLPSKVAQVVYGDYYYPAKGAYGKYRISAIRAIDSSRNGTASYASLAAGGLGYNYTTVSIQSQRGFGLNYTVEIYGY